MHKTLCVSVSAVKLITNQMELRNALETIITFYFPPYKLRCATQWPWWLVIQSRQTFASQTCDYHRCTIGTPFRRHLESKARLALGVISPKFGSPKMWYNVMIFVDLLNPNDPQIFSTECQWSQHSNCTIYHRSTTKYIFHNSVSGF